jgi:hypothetical protein
MTPEQLTDTLRELLKKNEEIYRHIVALIKAILKGKR